MKAAAKRRLLRPAKVPVPEMAKNEMVVEVRPPQPVEFTPEIYVEPSEEEQARMRVSLAEARAKLRPD